MTSEDEINTKAEAKIVQANETESIINDNDDSAAAGTISADKKRSSSKSPVIIKKESTCSKKVKDFYEKQNSLLEKYEDDSKIVNVSILCINICYLIYYIQIYRV